MTRRVTLVGLGLLFGIVGLVAACTFNVADLRAPVDAGAEKAADKASDATGDGSDAGAADKSDATSG